MVGQGTRLEVASGRHAVHQQPRIVALARTLPLVPDHLKVAPDDFLRRQVLADGFGDLLWFDLRQRADGAVMEGACQLQRSPLHEVGVLGARLDALLGAFVKLGQAGQFVFGRLLDEGHVLGHRGRLHDVGDGLLDETVRKLCGGCQFSAGLHLAIQPPRDVAVLLTALVDQFQPRRFDQPFGGEPSPAFRREHHLRDSGGQLEDVAPVDQITDCRADRRGVQNRIRSVEQVARFHARRVGTPPLTALILAAGAARTRHADFDLGSLQQRDHGGATNGRPPVRHVAGAVDMGLAVLLRRSAGHQSMSKSCDSVLKSA